jgi:Domain of unknown function (DUF222)/HNH endonuclease
MDTEYPNGSDTASPASTSCSPPALSISLEELEAQITELAGHLNAANYRWLSLIAEFDRRKGWADSKLASCAHWLNFRCGLNLGAAREKVRVGHALADLPKIAASMARGELSYSKVRALTRVACSATEDTLLNIALQGTAYHVERMVSGFRRAQEAEALSREAQQHTRRSLTYWFAEDGSLILKARLPALAGALLIQALGVAIEATPKKEISAEADEEQRISFESRRADALAVLAESFLAASESAPNTAGRRHSADRHHSADRYQIVVHVDAETLRERRPGRCEIEHGPAIPIETVRRLSCDASLIKVIEDEKGKPLDVGRKTRSIPTAIRRALNTRDAGCRFPGCTHQRYVDAHHIEHWADGGETKLANLVTLCRLHHRLVHEGEISIETLPDGTWRFLRPDGRHYEVIRVSPELCYDGDELRSRHAALGIRIDNNTTAARWRGGHMDYDLGVWFLCDLANRARNASRRICDIPAETSGTASRTTQQVIDEMMTRLYGGPPVWYQPATDQHVGER